MFWQVFISGFLLGGISSFHCVGMCGPLALSLPLAGYSRMGRVWGVLLYNLGRTTTYSLLGLLFGFLGRQVFIAGFQQVFSIVLGILILVAFILLVLGKKGGAFGPAALFYTKLQSIVARFLRIRSFSGFYLTGLANGLLPCGMVYLAITGALATSNSWYGAEFMAAFGLGTLPALFLLPFAGLMVSLKARMTIRRLTPYAYLLMAVLLIVRGLNLGIPYLSPYFAGSSAVAPCH